MDLYSYTRLSLQARMRLMGDAQEEADRASKRLASLLVLDAQAEAARLFPGAELILFGSDPDKAELWIDRVVSLDGSPIDWAWDALLATKVQELVLDSLEAAQRLVRNRVFECDSTNSRAGLYQIRLR